MKGLIQVSDIGFESEGCYAVLHKETVVGDCYDSLKTVLYPECWDLKPIAPTEYVATALPLPLEFL